MNMIVIVLQCIIIIIIIIINIINTNLSLIFKMSIQKIFFFY